MEKTKTLKGYKIVKSAPSYGVTIRHDGTKYTLVERDIERIGMTDKQVDKMVDYISDYLDTFDRQAYSRVYYYAKKLGTKVDYLVEWYGY